MCARCCGGLVADEMFVRVSGSELLSSPTPILVDGRVVRVALCGCLETAREIGHGWSDTFSPLVLLHDADLRSDLVGG